MNFRYIKNIVPAAVMLLGFSSCISDLDVENIDPRKDTTIKAENLLNKCYAEFVLEGYGPGSSELDLGDSGLSVLYRLLWNANQLTTDEALCGWTDNGIAEFDYNTYSETNDCLYGLYWRLSLGMGLCNQYLNNCADYDKTMTAEAHFLRALYSYYLLDNFGNPAYTTVVSSEAPAQIKSAELFDVIVKELEDNMDDMLAPSVRKNGTQNYGRADQSAAWFLLMRLYLNAEKYTGTPQWDKAKYYAEKVIKESGREIWMGDDAVAHKSANGEWSAYQMLFMADNDCSGAFNESVFSFILDGKTTASWGASTFLVASTWDKNMVMDYPATTGEAWGGNRTRKDLIEKFITLEDFDKLSNWQPATIIAGAGDDRALFYGDNADGGRGVKDRKYTNDKLSEFTEGIATVKYSSQRADGKATSGDAAHTDNDIMLFRLAEAYLSYAEAEARAAGSEVTLTEGTKYINVLRERANNADTRSAYSLQEVLDERSRELYFEGVRRQDLIRFGCFGGSNYTWQWKAGQQEGGKFPAYRNIFPLPAKELGTNNNLVQNPGYNPGY